MGVAAHAWRMRWMLIAAVLASGCAGLLPETAAPVAPPPAPAVAASTPAWWCNQKVAPTGTLHAVCYLRRDLGPEDASIAGEAVTAEMMRIGARGALKVGADRFARTDMPIDVGTVNGHECGIFAAQYVFGSVGEYEAAAVLEFVPDPTGQTARPPMQTAGQ